MEKQGARERKEEPPSLEGSASSSWLLRSPEDGGMFCSLSCNLDMGKVLLGKGERPKEKKNKTNCSQGKEEGGQGSSEIKPGMTGNQRQIDGHRSPAPPAPNTEVDNILQGLLKTQAEPP